MNTASGRKARPLTMLLVAANLCALGLLLYTAWTGTQTTTLLATAAKPFPVPELQLQPDTSTATLPALENEPLFYSTRHFYTPPPPSALPATPPKPDYRLVGTFVIPSKPTVALLASASGASRKVKPGDDLEGWTVQSVESGHVVLQYQTQTVEISRGVQTGQGGMQVVPLSRTAQLAPAGDARPAAGLRRLGGPPLERSMARGTPSIAAPPLRFYRPPPQ